MSKMKFMSIQIDNLTMQETLNEIDRLVVNNEKSYIVTPNVDHIVKLEKDKELKQVYENAALVLADGKPLIWISKLYKNPIKEKISGSDLFPLMCEMAANKKYSMFFLGAAEGVANRAAYNLKQKYNELNVVGTYSPPYGFEKNDKEIERIIRMINDAKPDILIVGLGCPKQEKFIYRYKEQLNVPLSLGLGASLDFEAENIKRAPKWMANHGLEWLYRMMQDPKRLIKRYLIDDVEIIKLIWKYRK